MALRFSLIAPRNDSTSAWFRPESEDLYAVWDWKLSDQS